MRVHTATTPLPLRQLSTGTPLPRNQLQRTAQRKIWGRKRGKWWTGLFPSNTWVNLDARHLAQQIETGIRPTGSTTVNSHRNLPLQSQQSRPPHPTVQRTAAVVSSFRPLPLSIPNRRVSRLHPPHIFSFYVKKIPASHRTRGGTPTVSLALGANRESKERVKGKASRVQSSRTGSAVVCVRRKVQHRNLRLPKSTRFALLTAVMVAVHTGEPTG